MLVSQWCQMYPICLDRSLSLSLPNSSILYNEWGGSTVHCRWTSWVWEMRWIHRICIWITRDGYRGCWQLHNESDLIAHCLWRFKFALFDCYYMLLSLKKFETSKSFIKPSIWKIRCQSHVEIWLARHKTDDVKNGHHKKGKTLHQKSKLVEWRLSYALRPMFLRVRYTNMCVTFFNKLLLFTFLIWNKHTQNISH